MKKHTWTIAFASCLLAFTVFLGMDTFILSSAYQTDATGMNTEMFARAEVSAGKTGQDQEEKAAENGAGRFSRPEVSAVEAAVRGQLKKLHRGAGEQGNNFRSAIPRIFRVTPSQSSIRQTFT